MLVAQEVLAQGEDTPPRLLPCAICHPTPKGLQCLRVDVGGGYRTVEGSACRTSHVWSTWNVQHNVGLLLLRQHLGSPLFLFCAFQNYLGFDKSLSLFQSLLASNTVGLSVNADYVKNQMFFSQLLIDITEDILNYVGRHSRRVSKA